MAKTEQAKATWEHRGGTVSVHDNGKFSWDLGDDSGQADSLDLAKKAIEKAKSELEKAARVPVSIAAVYVRDGEIKSTTIVGLHASRHEFLTKPPVKLDVDTGRWGRRHRDDAFYADTPEIRQMLADRIAAKAKLESLEYPLSVASILQPDRYNGLAKATKDLNASAIECAKSHAGLTKPPSRY